MMEQNICTPFMEDVYLYDLNQPTAPPLAYRSARGGEEQPVLTELLGIAFRTWTVYEEKLYDGELYLEECGTIVLPVFGGLGRFVLVIKTSLSHAAFSCLTKQVAKVPLRECAAIESAVRTVGMLHLLIESCEQAETVGAADECVLLASQLMGVTVMPPQSAERAFVQEQAVLPPMQPSGQALLICILTFLSLMRNVAHARSGWLYAVPNEGAFTIQAALRCDASAARGQLLHLRALLEQGGVVFGEHMIGASKKRSRPRNPLCARCHCPISRCTECISVQWAVLPFVCDAALLGIKNYFCFEI